MTTIERQWQSWRTSGVVGQLVRFGVAGGISSVIYSVVYLGCADWLFPRRWAWAATAAVPPAFLIAAGCGFVLHSKWSFKGHGTRDPGGRQQLRFLIVQAGGMALNMIYAWGLSTQFGLPNWVPLVPAILVTPFVTFFFQRQWVFA